MVVNSGNIFIDIDNKDTSGVISGIQTYGSYGLTINGGSITCDLNSTVNGNGNGDVHSDVIYMRGSPLYMNGGSLTVEHGGKGNAISTNRDINVSGGTLSTNIRGTESRTISSTADINITGGFVTAYAEDGTGNDAIYSTGTINIGSEDSSAQAPILRVIKDWSNDGETGIYTTGNMRWFQDMKM